MKLLQGKPLHIRKRIAATATGAIALILIVVMIYVDTRPQKAARDPESTIANTYTTFIIWVQSRFHSK